MKEAPRFPSKSGRPRQVDDKTNLCRKWSRNGACELDRDFNITEKVPFDSIRSLSMFGFMQKACMKSCQWAPEGKSLIMTLETKRTLYKRML